MGTPLEQVQENLLTLEEYVRLYEEQGPLEIVDGEKRFLMPPVMIHVIVTRLIFNLLFQFTSTHQLGEVFSEGPFVQTYQSNWVRGARVPDVLFFAAERWQNYIANTEDWLSKPAVLIPDLVVEVVSPNDKFSEVQDKVDGYLRDGVHLVWVFDPQRQCVNVYQKERFITLQKTDTLTGDEILPGFTLLLTDIFKDSYQI